MRLWRAGDDGGALRTALLAARFAPLSPVATYNAGAIGWWLQREPPAMPDRAWRSHREAFLRVSAGATGPMAAAVDAARAMVDGQPRIRPFVIGTD